MNSFQSQEVRVFNRKTCNKSQAVSRKDPLNCLETTDITKYMAKLCFLKLQVSKEANAKIYLGKFEGTLF